MDESRELFALLCLDARETCWIGHGPPEAMTAFYADAPLRMARLQRFLNKHRNKVLVFCSLDTIKRMYGDDWKEFEAPWP